MKFACRQDNLAKALGIVNKAVPVKSINPLLSNILVVAEDGRLKLCATNLETAITTYVPAVIEKDGGVGIPAKIFKDFVLTITSSSINFEMDDSILHAVSDKTKSKFSGMDAQEFPEMPQFSEEITFITLDPKEFSQAVSLVGFAATSDDSRPVFTGIYLSFSKDAQALTIVASDGSRLSEKTIAAQGELENFNVIVPAKTLLEVSKVFGSSAESIKFGLNKNANQALFESEDTLIATRILDGVYPDYKRIIPQETPLHIEFNPEELLEAVRLTHIFGSANDTNVAVKIKINPDGYLQISSASSETGAHESQVAATIDGDEMQLAFDAKFLMDLLNNVKVEKMVFKASSPTSPAIFRPLEEETFLHLIAPMQVK